MKSWIVIPCLCCASSFVALYAAFDMQMPSDAGLSSTLPPILPPALAVPGVDAGGIDARGVDAELVCDFGEPLASSEITVSEVIRARVLKPWREGQKSPRAAMSRALVFAPDPPDVVYVPTTAPGGAIPARGVLGHFRLAGFQRPTHYAFYVAPDTSVWVFDEKWRASDQWVTQQVPAANPFLPSGSIEPGIEPGIDPTGEALGEPVGEAQNPIDPTVDPDSNLRLSPEPVFPIVFIDC